MTRIWGIIAEKNKEEISANPLYPRHPRSINPYTESGRADSVGICCCLDTFENTGGAACR
jgi:hypothetical protein